MRRVAIVQARHNSSRLPGKVLREIGGRPMLAWVLSRLARATRIDEIVVATSVGADDDPIAAIAAQLGYRFVRGSEADVLSRYALAVKESDADVVVRVTADCPLIDPGLVDDVVFAFGERPWAFDFAANTLDRTYPRGLDVEVTHRDVLLQADAEAVLPYERAHVMPFLYARPESFRLHSVRGAEDHSAHRWTVDTLEDFGVITKICERLGPGDEFSWRGVLELVLAHPELEAENAGVVQKPIERG